MEADAKGPEYSNAMPVHNSGTGSNSEAISADVTDSLSGVDKKSIELMVRAGSAGWQNVVNKDLTITDLDGGGYNVSIALNEVRHEGSGTKLNVSTSLETAINWYVKAKDMASNESTSDSNADKRDDADATRMYDDCHRVSDGSNDCYTFTVDGVAPVMERAYTGDWFDETDNKTKGDRRVSRNNYLPGSSMANSIRVVFDEPLDGSTVTADDFTVDGVAPDDADHYSSGSTGGTNAATPKDTVNGVIGRSVFLTLSADLASNATPVVALVGSVDDIAGNTLSSGSKRAIDGIAPSATVEVDKTLSQKTVTVTVTTDEDIRLQAPELKLYVSDALDKDIEDLDEMDTFTVEREVKGNDKTPIVLRNPAGEPEHTGSATDLIAEEVTLDLLLTKAPVMDRSTGLRNGEVTKDDVVPSVKYETPDANKNALPITVDSVTAATGKVTVTIPVAATNTQKLDVGDAIVLTYRGKRADPAGKLSGVPPSFTGKRQGQSNVWEYTVNITRDDKYAVTAAMEDANRNQGTGGKGDPRAKGATVFEIDGELAGDTDTDATSIPSDDPAGANPVAIRDPYYIELNWEKEANEYVGDSNTAVTLTKATLNGTDVLANAVAQDSNSYRIRIDGISLGEHTLVYNAMDAAGNTNARDRDLKFTVVEAPTWNLELKADMNLISLPSNPSSSNIDDVFGDTPGINLIFTFEKGQALVAVKNPDTGEFAGTLKTIDARHAYWVSVANQVTVSIDIPQTSQQTVLPSIPVKGGEWNLLPVLSLGSIDSDAPGEGAKFGTLIDADAYLGKFQIAFGWEGGKWSRIEPDASTEGTRLTNDTLTGDVEGNVAAADKDDDPLKVGMGYWVLYTEDAYIVPR